MASGTIPAGLKASHMRARMEDKSTIASVGGLYVGGTPTVSFIDTEGAEPIVCHVTEELTPSATADLPLVSNGANAKPEYKQIVTESISDGAVTGAKLGSGTVVDKDGKKMVLEIKPGSDSNILVIRYYQAN